MKRNQLSVAFIRKMTRPGRYMDGGGLMLVVKPIGGKSWIQRLVIRGKRRDIGLGSVEFVSLAEARALAFENRKVARSGGDPTAGPGPAAPTFAEGIEAVLALQAPNWRDGGKSEKQWRSSLRDYAGPLMDRPVSDIDAGAVLTVLSPIWNTKRETARRVLQRIGAVLRWAVAGGHRDSTPIEAVRAALPKNGAKQRHHRALPHAEVGAALTTIRESRPESRAWPATQLALEFVALTTARSGEVRGMKWEEVDVGAATWTIPADRIKAGREHRVPLSKAALAVLKTAKALSDGEGLVFPSATGRALSDNTLSKLLRERGVNAVVHGFRSSFRDWCGESGIAREVAEACLAHVIKDAAERAYARSDLLDRRRDVMEKWARYVSGELRGKVVTLRG